jgi:hypothetical protein
MNIHYKKHQEKINKILISNKGIKIFNNVFNYKNNIDLDFNNCSNLNEKSLSDNLINSLDNRNSTEENENYNNINEWNNLISEINNGGDNNNNDYFEMNNDDEKYINNNINMTVNMIYINGIINTPDDS